MQSPKKYVSYYIDVNDEADINEMVYTFIYLKDPKESIAYKMLKDNPHTPLKSIKWRLENEHGIQKRISKLKKMAENCRLPYTE